MNEVDRSKFCKYGYSCGHEFCMPENCPEWEAVEQIPSANTGSPAGSLGERAGLQDGVDLRNIDQRRIYSVISDIKDNWKNGRKEEYLAIDYAIRKFYDWLKNYGVES